MKNKLTLVVIVLVVLAGWGVVWFFDHYERATKEINTGYSGEAWLNNYLAAIRFLQKTGHEVSYKSSLLSMGKLPPPREVLIIPTHRFDIGPEKVASMLDWVKSGGHLIVQAFRYNKDSQRNDYLLSALDVYVENFNNNKKSKNNKTKTSNTGKDKSVNESNSETKNRNKTDCKPDTIDINIFTQKDETEKNTCPDYYTVNTAVVKGAEKKKVRLGTRYYLKNDDEEYFTLWSVNDENGTALLELGVGEGRVTIINSMSFMNNFQIGKNDHASFLWHMVNTGKTQPKIWFILNDDMPPLYKLLYANAKYAVISFFVLLAVWIAWAARRFGPKLIPPALQRRQLSEHIHAAGNFLWQQQEQFALIESSKQAIMDALASSQPHWLQLKEAERINKLARHAGLDNEAVNRAFTVKHAVKELEFIKIMQTLSTIRNQL